MDIKIVKKTMINTSVKKFILAFLCVNFLIVLYSFVFKSSLWLLNTQVAFVSTLLITIASFLSYRKNIKARISNLDLSNEQVLKEDRDKIDEIDDPFDLYSENEEVLEEDLSPEKIKEILKEEKAKVKNNYFKNTIFSASGFLSIYRILAYAILVFSFFALNNNNIFLAIPFIVGITIVPVSILFSKLFFK